VGIVAVLSWAILPGGQGHRWNDADGRGVRRPPSPDRFDMGTLLTTG
jgi:hypothetical protein